VEQQLINICSMRLCLVTCGFVYCFLAVLFICWLTGIHWENEQSREKKQEWNLWCRGLYRNPFFPVGGILSGDIHLLISLTFIGKFVVESAPPTVQVLIYCLLAR